MQDGFIIENGKVFFRKDGSDISPHTLDGVVSVTPGSSGPGCWIGLRNGLSVSVQWKDGNYCSNRWATKPSNFSPDAEVAVFLRDGSFAHLSEYDDVLGWQSVDDVICLIQIYLSE